MRINVNLLDVRTIGEAIKQIEEYQKRIKEELIPEFLKRCAEAVRDMANNIISGLPYNAKLISQLQNGWRTETSDDGKVITLINSYDKAVYVEFGTGNVGSKNAHEMASESGYKYDVNNHGEKGWRFTKHVDELVPLDLPHDSYTIKVLGHTGMWFDVRTQGAPATMFLYQAASDFVDNKVYERVWDELVKGK